MTSHKKSASYWSGRLQEVIQECQDDGWVVGIGENEDAESYELLVYDYDFNNKHEAVTW
jgi:carotenoid cleavage dioxygenase-like enzyme